MSVDTVVQEVRLRFLLRERDIRNCRGETVLSVYRDYGVVPKASRDDNFNKTPVDISNYKLVRPGNLVVNKMKAWQGSLAVSEHQGIVSGDYMVCEIIAPDVDPRFLHYLLRSSHMRQEYGIRSTGIRPSQWRLYWDDLADISVKLVSTQQQRAIASFLDAELARVDTLIAKKRHLIKLLEERRVAVTDHTIISAVDPKRPVAALASYRNGWAFKPSDFSDEGLPVVRIQQLVDPTAPVDRYNGQLPEQVQLRDGDLVFSWSGSLEVRVWNRGPAYLNQHLFRVDPAPHIDRHWLRYGLDTATRLFDEFTHGSAMTHITQPMMKEVRLPVPSLEEQRRAAGYLDEAWGELQDLTDKLHRQIALLVEHRQTLVTAAVTGQLKIPRAAA